MKLNTPTAIFLGLALIAVAIFFRQPSISEAQANNHQLSKQAVAVLLSSTEFRSAVKRVVTSCRAYPNGGLWCR